MVKRKLLRAKKLLVRRPKLVIVVSFVIFFLLFAGFEYARSQTYIHKVEDYKQSIGVLELQDAIRKMSLLAEDGRPDPTLCELDIEGSIEYRNEAYAANGRQGRLDEVITTVNQKASSVIPSPRFASMLIFLPHVSEARKLSAQLKESTEQIKYLTSQDKESLYCLSLLDVLSEVYFVSELRAPQGVGALRVGQIENFQVDVDQAQEKLRTLTPPGRFVAQHILINDFLNDLRVDVRLELNDRENFARAISEDYEVLNAILTDIRYSADSLQKLPEQILLHSAALY